MQSLHSVSVTLTDWNQGRLIKIESFVPIVQSDFQSGKRIFQSEKRIFQSEFINIEYSKPRLRKFVRATCSCCNVTHCTYYPTHWDGKLHNRNIWHWCPVHLAEWSSTLDSSVGLLISRVWVRVRVLILVSLSKTLKWIRSSDVAESCRSLVFFTLIQGAKHNVYKRVSYSKTFKILRWLLTKLLNTNY